MAQALTPRAPTDVHSLKAPKAVLEFMRGKPRLKLRLPVKFEIGHRLFVREWAGGALGRADLCLVTGHDGDHTEVVRTWGWSQGKVDDDLAFLGLVVTKSDYPMLTDAVVD